MAITYVQSRGVQPAGEVASVSLAYSSSVVAGNLLVVVGSNEDAGSPSCTDTQSNTYGSADATVANGSSCQSTIFSAVAGSSAACTVTFDYTGSDWASIAISEHGGSWDGSRVNDTATATGTGTTPDSGDMTTSAASLLIGGMSRTTEGSAPTHTVGAGYTAIFNGELEADEMPILAEYDIEAGSGTFDADATVSLSVTWAMCGVAYIEVAAGGTTNPFSMGAVNLFQGKLAS